MENLLCNQIKRKISVNETETLFSKINKIVAMNETENNNKKEYSKVDVIYMLALLLPKDEISNNNINDINKKINKEIEVYEAIYQKL
jgi:hypothetical protein